MFESGLLSSGACSVQQQRPLQLIVRNLWIGRGMRKRERIFVCRCSSAASPLPSNQVHSPVFRTHTVFKTLPPMSDIRGRSNPRCSAVHCSQIGRAHV